MGDEINSDTSARRKFQSVLLSSKHLAMIRSNSMLCRGYGLCFSKGRLIVLEKETETKLRETI